MGRIIALAGLSGSGKSTAISFLLEKGSFERVYLGGFVTEEVRLRGLPPGAESEKSVRLELRAKAGQTAIFDLARGFISERISSQRNILLDALFSPQERDALNRLCDGQTQAPIVLGIEAAFETRAYRLAKRPERPFTRSELASRDEFELANLGTDQVVQQADITIRNEGSIKELHLSLACFLEKYFLL